MARRPAPFHTFIPPTFDFQMQPGVWPMRFPMQAPYQPPLSQMTYSNGNQNLAKRGVDVAMQPGAWPMRFSMQAPYQPPPCQIIYSNENQNLAKKGVDVAIQTELSGPVYKKAEQVSNETQTFMLDFMKARAKFKSASPMSKDPQKFFEAGTPEHRQYRVSKSLILKADLPLHCFGQKGRLITGKQTKDLGHL